MNTARRRIGVAAWCCAELDDDVRAATQIRGDLDFRYNWSCLARALLAHTQRSNTGFELAFEHFSINIVVLK